MHGITKKKYLKKERFIAPPTKPPPAIRRTYPLNKVYIEEQSQTQIDDEVVIVEEIKLNLKPVGTAKLMDIFVSSVRSHSTICSVTDAGIQG